MSCSAIRALPAPGACTSTNLIIQPSTQRSHPPLSERCHPRPHLHVERARVLVLRQLLMWEPPLVLKEVDQKLQLLRLPGRLALHEELQRSQDVVVGQQEARHLCGWLCRFYLWGCSISAHCAKQGVLALYANLERTRHVDVQALRAVPKYAGLPGRTCASSMGR